LQGISALGLSENVRRDLMAGRFAAAGALPVNLSGGLLGQGAPVGATGVGQTAACALFMEGRHPSALQPTKLPAVALADTHGGIATTNAVTILTQADYR
jgi:acetyl-CoA C-acetyltransferase